jgi:hypothetical protein
MIAFNSCSWALDLFCSDKNLSVIMSDKLLIVFAGFNQALARVYKAVHCLLLQGVRFIMSIKALVDTSLVTIEICCPFFVVCHGHDGSFNESDFLRCLLWDNMQVKGFKGGFKNRKSEDFSWIHEHSIVRANTLGWFVPLS